MKVSKRSLVCAIMVMNSSAASRLDHAVYSGIKQGTLCLAAAYCGSKCVVHGYMTKFYFKQSLVPDLHEQAQRNHTEVEQPALAWSEWATAPWGMLKDHKSYSWHGATACIWAALSVGCLYVLRYT